MIYAKSPYRRSENQDVIFADGKHLGSIIQSYLINPENRYDVYNIYYNLCHEYEWIKDIPQLCNGLDKLVSLQNEMCIFIEMGEYLIKFEGTLDAIAMGEDGYYIVDIKTAKQRRTETMLYSKYQCVFYVALRSLVMGIEQGQMKFEYRVFIKNKSKGVMQRMTRMIDIEDARKQLFKYLRAYAEKGKLQSLEKK